MPGVKVDTNAIDEIASRLTLRDPNRDAVETIALSLSQHYDVEERPAPFLGVVDSATGVGKTWIMSGAIEYLATVEGVRNFAVIAPGRTILTKTVNQFTDGHPKSLLGPMSVRPVVVTADNFDSASMRAAMDDDDQTKLYVFTVQSLLKPTTKVGRRTHAFHEGLGAGFYDHLAGLDDLVVFADEHHLYVAPKFSEAIDDLEPWAMVGLTATPHRSTPVDEIIFRYPLAAAIAERLVKTPVIVGRLDDRNDETTKLADGLRLLEAKRQVAESWSAENGRAMVNPVMLVVAQSIDEAEEFGTLLRSEEFDGGSWAEKVLVVHSSADDESLEALEAVEDPASPVRIIVSVNMLGVGWDVKNVFVIASMRSSVSTILTEQTLGRGLRLPFGEYTGVEMLDTLEVLAHERYQQLLDKAGVLNESFIDSRTRAVTAVNSAGETVAVSTTEQVNTPLIPVEPADGASATVEDPAVAPAPAITSVEGRTAHAESEIGMKETYFPVSGMPVIEVPRLRMSAVKSSFSLNDITDEDAIAKLARKIAADPDKELKRIKVSARLITGPDGSRRVETVTSTAVDRIEATPSQLPLGDSRQFLIDAVLAAPITPARKGEGAAAGRLVDVFIASLGEKAEDLLSRYRDRAAALLIRAVTDEHRRFTSKPQYQEVTDLTALNKARITGRKVSADRMGKFSKADAYEGWTRSVYAVNWFDSKPERTVANILDDTSTIDCWLRLVTGDLPILWTEGGRNYNADLIAVEADGTRWVIEVKADKDMTTEEVQAKREAAKRWANHVNADPAVTGTWRYLLLSETDIAMAKDSWSALKTLGS